MTTRPFSRCRTARRRMYGSVSTRISIAERTRVESPRCSRAPWSARALMTVPSMPMLSAVTRSRASPAAVVPRMMLPPPITMPTCVPAAAPATISSATRSSEPGSMPTFAEPARISPLSLSRTRRGEGSIRSGVPDPEPHEAPDDDVLAQLGDRLVEQVLHLPVRVPNRRLLEETDLLVVLLDLPIHDLLENGLRLARRLRLLQEDRPFPLDQRGIDARAIHRLRVRGRDLHRQRPHEIPEVVRARDEVRLAVHLDEHAQHVARVDVRVHHALLRGASCLGGGARHSLLPQHLDRLLDFPVGFGQGLLALHHARAGPLAQVLDERGGDRHSMLLPIVGIGFLGFRIPRAAQALAATPATEGAGCTASTG